MKRRKVRTLSRLSQSWLLYLLALWIMGVAPAFLASGQSNPAKPKPRHPAGSSGSTKHSTSSHSNGHRKTAAHTATRSKHSKRKPLSPKALAKSHSLQRAFVASSQLRPMAQELTAMRSPAAYAGVTAYAQSHIGEASSAAYLALGHAYLEDHKFPEAVASLKKSSTAGQSLSDYADYLSAQAYLQGGKWPEAELVLSGFTARHPDSIFVKSIPVLEANALIEEGDPQTALARLKPHFGEPIANHADFQLAQAKAEMMAGQPDSAAKLFRRVFLSYPLSNEAQVAKTQLAIVGAAAPLSPEERRNHADALYKAGRFNEAGEEYRSLAADPAEAGSQARNALLVAAAHCDWKLKRLNKQELERIPDTQDETGARRMYLLMELARDKDDGDAQRNIVEQMRSRFAESPWLAEALYSSGNMYLLRKDYAHAIEYYGDLARRFPKSCEPERTANCSNYSPSSHWRAAWLNYRLKQYSEAARLMDEQIAYYPGGKEIPGALYWRARVYEQQERRPAMAAAYYQTVIRVYQHYYYAAEAKQRLMALGTVSPEYVAMLTSMRPEMIPELSDDVPEDDPHVVKARLLANAGLNEYIAAEIQAGDGSEEWGAFAEAEIYTSYGETFRAMRVLKRAIPFYSSAPITAMPLTYWRILFPQPYWSQIKTSAAANGLDPYMVASLIRQESEFNPMAISNKSAYGLMQLLPSVGKTMAKAEGMKHFDANQLLDPNVNIQLGCRYLRQTMDKFGGRPELVFAAYNAGDARVVDWRSAAGDQSIDEFVESIPFTETRDYVQAILRNEDIYRSIDQAAAQTALQTKAN
ncbi:transglycosylase SLT domain-containing protein [Acidisarcina polymorpha]|nr:transglycosylase SLT domain-containing protein [Acidisarcina polymorpha]